MKKTFKRYIYLFSVIAFLFLPSFAFATKIYLDTNHKEFNVGDIVLMNVLVDSENKNINVVDGNIEIKYKGKSVSILDISLEGSDFSLWPRKPSLSPDGTRISFVGGVQSGLNSKNSVLFKIIFSLDQTGKVELNPSNISVYISDGKGTKDVLNTKHFVINILPKKENSLSVSDLNELAISDTTPPESFEIFLGQESSVFEGKKFLSFNAVDKQSSIKYYEVKEGDFPTVRSGNTYILQEQNMPVKIVVTAYDTFGNARKSNYNPSTKNISVYLISFIFIIIILISAFVIFKKKKKSNVV